MYSIPQDSDSLNKQCTKCQRVLPATTEFFYLHKGCKDGLRKDCKECVKARARSYDVEHKEHVKARKKRYAAENREKIAEQKKQYVAAHQVELLVYKKSYYAEHQEENKERSRQWYAEHKEYVSEYGKRYRRENQEKKREQDRKYREEHAEEKRARDSRYRKEHAEELSAKQRKYHAEHLEERLEAIRRYNQTERGIIAKRARAHNRRARKNNAPGAHTTEELYQQLKRQKGKCYYCKVKLSTSRDSWNADHVIPLSRGGSNDMSNIVITCPTCNRKKNDKLPHEWPLGGRLL